MRRYRYQYGTVARKKRATGPDVWVFRYSDDGVRRSTIIGTVEQFPKRVQAEKAAEALRMDANADNPAGRGITLGALTDRYQKDEMPKRFSTSDSYSAWIRAYIKPKWGTYNIIDVKPFAVETWLKGLDLSPKSRGHIKTIMMSLFNCAMRWEIIPFKENPMSLVRVPGVSKRQSKSVVLSAEQVRDLIQNIDQEPFKTMAWLSVCLGLEPSVIAGLQWQDIDVDVLVLNIVRSVISNHVGPAKNEYRQGPLPLDPALANMLDEWREQAQFIEETDWVFASPYFPDENGRGGKYPYSMRHVAEDHLWPAAKAAGLGEKIGWRTFRRTYSSLLRKLGVDIKVQQELMRHADIRTTLNLYTEPFSDDVRRANGNLVQMVLKEVAVS